MPIVCTGSNGNWWKILIFMITCTYWMIYNNGKGKWKATCSYINMWYVVDYLNNNIDLLLMIYHDCVDMDFILVRKFSSSHCLCEHIEGKWFWKCWREMVPTMSKENRFGKTDGKLFSQLMSMSKRNDSNGYMYLVSPA